MERRDVEGLSISQLTRGSMYRTDIDSQCLPASDRQRVDVGTVGPGSHGAIQRVT